MTDAVFYEMLANVDAFSLEQKKSLLSALKRSLTSHSVFFRKSSSKTDKHLLESLIGAGGNTDISLEQIKQERLSR